MKLYTNYNARIVHESTLNQTAKSTYHTHSISTHKNVLFFMMAMLSQYSQLYIIISFLTQYR